MLTLWAKLRLSPPLASARGTRAGTPVCPHWQPQPVHSLLQLPCAIAPVSSASSSAKHCWNHPALSCLPRQSPSSGHQIQNRSAISASLPSYSPPRPTMAQHGPSPATRHPTAAALRLLQAGPSPEFPRPAAAQPAGTEPTDRAGPGARRTWRKEGRRMPRKWSRRGRAGPASPPGALHPARHTASSPRPASPKVHFTPLQTLPIHTRRTRNI